MKIEYSTVCFTVDNYRKKIEDARTLLEKEGHSFGIQLHNSIKRDMYDAMIPYRKDIPFSIHSPMFSKYFVNLASSDFETAVSILRDSDILTSEWGTDIIFFHGFFMTELPILHDMKNYRKAMRNSIGDHFSLNNSFIMNPEVFESELFMEYKNRFTSNLNRLNSLFPHKIISLENDFTGIGSGLQRPAEIHEMIDNLWFDLGHFWCASLLHNFDFHEECYRIIDHKKITGVHLNHNLIKKTDPLESINDSHTHFYHPSEMNLAPVIRKLIDSGVESLTLEIVDGDLGDVKILLDWLQ